MTLHDLDMTNHFIYYTKIISNQTKKIDNLDFNKIKSFYVSENIIKKVKR